MPENQEPVDDAGGEAAIDGSIRYISISDLNPEIDRSLGLSVLGVRGSS